MANKVVVVLEDDQYIALQAFKMLGETDAEKLKNILLSYIYDKNIPKTKG